MDEVLNYVSCRLGQEKIRHEIHKFDSGPVMIDIWKDDLFYVVQIEDKKIGLSLVTEDTDFDAIPDRSYDGVKEFSIDFEKILYK